MFALKPRSHLPGCRQWCVIRHSSVFPGEDAILSYKGFSKRGSV